MNTNTCTITPCRYIVTTRDIVLYRKKKKRKEKKDASK